MGICDFNNGDFGDPWPIEASVFLEGRLIMVWHQQKPVGLFYIDGNLFVSVGLEFVDTCLV